MSRKLKPEDPDEIVFPTLIDVARHYGVTRKCVNDWTNEANPMPGVKPNFRKSEIDQWLQSRPGAMKRKLKSEPSTGSGNEIAELQLKTERAKARKETALADQHEIKVKLIDPRFVSAVEVNQLFSEFFIELRKNTTAIPVDMCAAYPASIRVDLQKDLSQRLNLLLNQMGDFVERFNRTRKVMNALDTEPEND